MYSVATNVPSQAARQRPRTHAGYYFAPPRLLLAKQHAYNALRAAHAFAPCAHSRRAAHSRHCACAHCVAIVGLLFYLRLIGSGWFVYILRGSAGLDSHYRAPFVTGTSCNCATTHFTALRTAACTAPAFHAHSLYLRMFYRHCPSCPRQLVWAVTRPVLVGRKEKVRALPCAARAFADDLALICCVADRCAPVDVYHGRHLIFFRDARLPRVRGIPAHCHRAATCLVT